MGVSSISLSSADLTTHSHQTVVYSHLFQQTVTTIRHQLRTLDKPKSMRNMPQQDLVL